MFKNTKKTYGICITHLGALPIPNYWTEWSLKLFALLTLLLLLTVFFDLNLAALLLFLSIFYRYFHAYCSSELADSMPPPLARPRRTPLSTFAHPYSFQTPYARVNQYLHSFIPFTGQLWNRLPVSVFPPSYDLQYFKREVSRQLASSSWLRFLIFLLFLGAVFLRAFFFIFFVVPLSSLLCYKKKMKEGKKERKKRLIQTSVSDVSIYMRNITYCMTNIH